MTRHGFRISSGAEIVDAPPTHEWADPSCDHMRDRVFAADGLTLIEGHAPIDPGFDRERFCAWVCRTCACGQRFDVDGECEACAERESAESEAA